MSDIRVNIPEYKVWKKRNDAKKNRERLRKKKIHRKNQKNKRMGNEIENPYKGIITFGKNGLPVSNRIGHGFGTRSILAFCEKHDAFYSFSAEDGWFKIMITL